MRIARAPHELEPFERTVAIGTFDGVHRGHRAAIEASQEAGLRSTVVTFDPHPRLVLGYDVQLLTTLERRLELIEEIGPDEALVLEFTPDNDLRTWDAGGASPREEESYESNDRQIFLADSNLLLYYQIKGDVMSLHHRKSNVWVRLTREATR